MGVGKYNTTSALLANRKYCLATGGVMLKSARTACKCLQVFLSLCKLKCNMKDWLYPYLNPKLEPPDA